MFPPNIQFDVYASKISTIIKEQATSTKIVKRMLHLRGLFAK